MKLLRNLSVLSALSLWLGTVHADPVSLTASLFVAAIGEGAAILLAQQLIGAAVAIGLSAYSASSAKRKQKAQAARARAEYNAGLTDRMATIISAEAPQRVIYGETFVGGAIVAMMTSNRPAVSGTTSLVFGVEGKNQDALRHLVVVIAAHECAEISDIRVDGVSLETLDGSGYSTSGLFSGNRTTARNVRFTANGAAQVVLPGLIGRVLHATQANVVDMDGMTIYPSFTVSGNTVQFLPALAGAVVDIRYDELQPLSVVRVQKHLGYAGEPADAYLMSAMPGVWTADHKLSGYCYLVVTLDLNDRRFQGGPPSIQARVRGKRVYDPRSGNTAYSANPALCAADFLSSPMWSGSSRVSVLTADVVAAANVCDTVISNPLAGSPGAPATVPLYTCNGSFTTDDSPEGVLEDIVESMAGYAFVAGGWRVLSGSWSTPVATLNLSDADGDPEILQVGTPWSDVYNSIRGNYIPVGQTASQDFAPYRNSVLQAADGQPLWDDVSFAFTNHAWRCVNLARIRVEKSRNGFTIRWPASMQHWGLQPGDRVWVNHPDYGLVNKTFRVTEWAFGLNTPVTLTLQEDTASVYDLYDQVVVDQTPNTLLPDPFAIPVVAAITFRSGTDELSIQADGTVRTGVRVSWENSTSLPAAAWLVLQHRVDTPADNTDPPAYQTIRVSADQESVILSGYAEGQAVILRMRYETSVAVGDWVSAGHAVVGKSEPPTNVASASLSVVGTQLILSWPQIADLDRSEYEVRESDSNWGEAGYVFRGRALSQAVNPSLVGAMKTWYVRAIDSSGNYSLASASASYTLGALPNVTSIEHNFFDTSLTNAEVALSWPSAAPLLGLGGYEVSYPGFSTVTNANRIVLPANWLGSRTYTVKVADIAGNLSSGTQKSITKVAPNPATGLRAQVIDNNVLLSWTLPARTSLPIASVLIRKGDTWETATTIGHKDGEFTSLQELVSGTYTYWVAVLDTDDNASTPVSITAEVSEPPDFVFSAEFESTFSGTRSNAISQGTSLVLPVDLTETFEGHFTSRGWASPQAQVTAGFPLFIQPGTTSGYYEEVFDYGTALASSQVNLTIAGHVVAGAPTATPTLSLSLDGVTYQNFAGLSQVFATNFRFVKVRVQVNQNTSGDLYRIDSINVRLNAKKKDDSGTVSALASDTDGTIVNFNKEFVDIESITLAVGATVPVSYAYEFKDEVQTGTYSVASGVATLALTAHGLIAGQTVRLFFSSGLAAPGVYTVASVINANSYTVVTGGSITSGAVTAYANSFRVRVFNSSGTRISAPTSWDVSGY